MFQPAAGQSLIGVGSRGKAGGTWSRALGGAALLSLEALSVAAAIALSAVDVDSFVRQNQATPDERRLLLLSTVGAPFLTAIVTLWVAFRGNERTAERLRSLGLRLSPLLVAYSVPVLSRFATWHARPLTFLLLLAGTTLLF